MSEEVKESTGLVLYCDGGCRGKTNPGFGGSGIHGYLFSRKVSKGNGIPKNFGTEKGYVPKQVKKEIKGEIVTVNVEATEVTILDFVDGTVSFSIPVSNNVAEITAVIKGLLFAIDAIGTHGINSVQIYSDSEYTCKGLTSWADTWKANKWLKNDGLPPANVELWKELLDLRDRISDIGATVKIDWIKAHNGDLGNERADDLATLGVMASKANQAIHDFRLYPRAEYWKFDPNKNPLLGHRRMYFNTQQSFNVVGEYYLGDHGKDDDLLGFTLADGTYSVVRLAEPDPVIEFVRSHQIAINGNLDNIAMICLDRMFRPMVYRDLLNYGIHATEQPDKYRGDLYCLDKEPLTRELRPPKLAMRAVESVSDLLVKLDRFLAKDEKLVVTDITDVLFTHEETKKGPVPILRPEFIVGYSALKVNVKYETNGEIKETPITITLGIDMLDRNPLKRLEDQSPKVSVITWAEAPGCFRFATVIECNLGCGIWCGAYSNLILVPPEKT